MHGWPAVPALAESAMTTAASSNAVPAAALQSWGKPRLLDCHSVASSSKHSLLALGFVYARLAVMARLPAGCRGLAQNHFQPPWGARARDPRGERNVRMPAENHGGSLPHSRESLAARKKGSRRAKVAPLAAAEVNVAVPTNSDALLARSRRLSLAKPLASPEAGTRRPEVGASDAFQDVRKQPSATFLLFGHCHHGMCHIRTFSHGA